MTSLTLDLLSSYDSDVSLPEVPQMLLKNTNVVPRQLHDQRNPNRRVMHHKPHCYLNLWFSHNITALICDMGLN